MLSKSERFAKWVFLVAARALTLVLLLAASACSGDTGPPDKAPGTTVLLKEIEVPHLPSPFYHFEYDTQGRITAASYAAGLFTYDLSYAGGRLAEIRNNTFANQDRLTYVYDNSGRVGEIRFTNAAGLLFTRLQLVYAGQKLTRIDRFVLSNSTFINDQTLSMSYDSDGNLLELTEHLAAIEGVQPEATFVDRFEQYDTGLNVDAFDLLHPGFFDHLILLPGVELQRGNPGKQTRSGDGINFSVSFTYTYDDQNKPVTKTGDLVFTNGPDAGRHFQTGSLFSYYPLTD